MPQSSKSIFFKCSLPILFKLSENSAREAICKGGFMIEVVPYNLVPVTEIRLDAGDRLLLYTDGVHVGFNPERQIYGEERLRRQMEWSVGLDNSGNFYIRYRSGIQGFRWRVPGVVG